MLLFYNSDTAVVEIAPEQIVRELSNHEKWAKIVRTYFKGESCSREMGFVDDVLIKLDINADAAYRAVVGEE